MSETTQQTNGATSLADEIAILKAQVSNLNSQMELVTDWISDVDEQLEEDEQVDGAMDSLLESKNQEIAQLKERVAILMDDALLAKVMTACAECVVDWATNKTPAGLLYASRLEKALLDAGAEIKVVEEE